MTSRKLSLPSIFNNHPSAVHTPSPVMFVNIHVED
jgi:hypothetical protein